MPTYLYRCQDCGAVFEASHSMFSEESVVCGKCDGVETVKIPTCPGIVFDWKNPGFDEGVVVGPQRFRSPAVPKSIEGG